MLTRMRYQLVLLLATVTLYFKLAISRRGLESTGLSGAGAYGFADHCALNCKDKFGNNFYLKGSDSSENSSKVSSFLHYCIISFGEIRPLILEILFPPLHPPKFQRSVAHRCRCMRDRKFSSMTGSADRIRLARQPCVTAATLDNFRLGETTPLLGLLPPLPVRN